MTATKAELGGHGSGVFVTTAAHGELIERVGPFVASAFVAVALSAKFDARGALVATTSARTLAGDLRVAKDTAASALSRLVEAGYLHRRIQPRAAGRFAAARYTVRPPAGFEISPCPNAEDPVAGHPVVDEAAVPRRETRRRRRRPERDGAPQLGLFGPASEISDTEPTP